MPLELLSGEGQQETLSSALFDLMIDVWDLWPQASSNCAFISPCPRGHFKPTQRERSSRSPADHREQALNVGTASETSHLIRGLETCRAQEGTTTLLLLQELWLDNLIIKKIR